MIHTYETFLSPSEVEFLRRVFDDLDARDGRGSAASGLAGIKHNREIELGDRAGEIKGIVLEACNRAPGLNYALLPKTVGTTILSAYEPGMAYGTHTDSAVGMDNGRIYRSDVSCTIFLDDPETYDGGELHIDLEHGECLVKLPVGGAVFYPTHFLHQVRPVTRGRRRACVLWLESLVRDPARRQILLDLEQLSIWAAKQAPIESEPRQKLVQIRENLYRMWLDT